MTNREHPVTQEIDNVTLLEHEDYTKAKWFAVGFGGVTRIEACTKSGLHADIPYVRVWKGDVAVAEFCQHNVAGVYFKAPT